MVQFLWSQLLEQDDTPLEEPWLGLSCSSYGLKQGYRDVVNRVILGFYISGEMKKTPPEWQSIRLNNLNWFYLGHNTGPRQCYYHMFKKKFRS